MLGVEPSKVSFAHLVVGIRLFELIRVEIDVRFVSKNGGVELVAKVTISGHPGSGTSTLVEGLCRHLNWEKINGGEIFRDIAKEKGMALEEFGQYCSEDEEVDQQLDTLLTETMMSENSPEIVESRLAGWWAYRNNLDCARIWIEVSEEIRASRVVNREGGSQTEQLQLIKERMDYDGARYQRYYAIDIDSREPYTHVIESDDLDAGEVLELVLNHLEVGA